MNDKNSKRAYDSKTDAYAVFGKMLATGNPPNDWNELVKEVEGETNRLGEFIAPTPVVAVGDDSLVQDGAE